MRKRQQWSHKHQVSFFEQLGQLTASGYGLKQALLILQATCPRLAADLKRIQAQVADGEPFWQELQPYIRPRLADELALIQWHGQQEAALVALGAREHLFYQQRQAVQQVLAYPVCLLLLVLGLGGLGSQVLQPQLAQAGLVSSVTLAPHVGLGIGLAVLGVALSMWLTWPVVRRYFWQYQEEGLVCLHLGLLLQSGISLATVVQASRRTETNAVLAQLFAGATIPAYQQAEAGATLLEDLQSLPRLPEVGRQQFRQGLTQTEVGANLLKVAAYLQAQQARRLKLGVALIQPLSFCVIGLLVIGLYCVWLLPMYQQMGDPGIWQMN